MQEKINQKENNFTERLIEAVKNSGLNKGQIAKKVGCSNVTLSRWLGGRVPDAAFYEPLARALSVRLNWLIAGELDEKKTNEFSIVGEEPAVYGGKPLQTFEEAAEKSDWPIFLHHIGEALQQMSDSNIKPAHRLIMYAHLRKLVDAAESSDRKALGYE